MEPRHPRVPAAHRHRRGEGAGPRGLAAPHRAAVHPAPLVRSPSSPRSSSRRRWSAMASPFLLRAVIDDALPQPGPAPAGLAGRRHGRRRRRDLRARRRPDLDLAPRSASRSCTGCAPTSSPTCSASRSRFFTRTRTGEVQSRITNDIGGMQSVVTSTATSIASNLTTAVATAVAMVALSWRLSLVSLRRAAAGDLADPPGRPDAPRDHRRAAARAGRPQRHHRGGPLDQRRAAVARRWAPGPRWSTGSPPPRARLIDLELRSQLAGRWRMASMSVIFAAIPAVIYLGAGLPVTAGTMTIGTLVAFTALQAGLFRPLIGLLNVGVSLVSSLALFARIFEYLDLPVEVDDPAHPVDVDPARVARPRPLRGRHVRLPRQRPRRRRRHRPRRPGRHARWRWSARPARARRTLAALVARLYDPDRRARHASTASTCATCGWPTWPRSSAWSARRPTCCTPPCGRTCATPSPTPPTPRSRTPRAPRRSTT